jgi:large subunit ribosomal protein L24
MTDVKVSGRLNKTAQGLAFSGPANLESADLKMLVAWLEGGGVSPSAAPESLTAHGDVAVSSERFAVDGLMAALDQEKIAGRLAYSWAAKDRPATLDGELRAAELDIDALTAFAKAAMADGSFEVPHEAALVLDIGKATFAGIDARRVAAQIKYDAGVLNIDRLSVGDLGGAALAISGHIDELSSQPRGRLTLDLDAKALAGLTEVAAKFVPRAAASWRGFADRLAPAKLHGVLTLDRAVTAGTVGKLELGGQVGALRVSLDGEATGEPGRLGDAVVHVVSRFDGDDGGALTRLLGLDRVLAVDQLPGQMTISADGPLNGDLHVKGLATAGGFAASVAGALRFAGDNAPAGKLDVTVSAADLRPLHRALTGQPGIAVPISVNAKMALAGSDVALTDVVAVAGKTSLHGRLALTLSSPIGIGGDVAADEIDAAAVSAMLLGFASGLPNANGYRSAAPIGAGAFGAANGALTFRLDRAAITPGLLIRDLKGAVRFSPSQIAFEDIDGGLAGGRVSGALAFRHDAGELAGRGHIDLAGADAAAIFATEPKLVDGRLTLKLQGDSVGRSTDALVGALHGSG